MAYMSKEGYDNLVAELHRLEAIERPKASAAIAIPMRLTVRFAPTLATPSTIGITCLTPCPTRQLKLKKKLQLL